MLKLPAEVFTPNAMYRIASDADKVYMAVVQEGLFFDRNGAIRFNPNKATYLSRLQKILAGEVDSGVVDIEKDELLEKGILTRSDPQVDLQRFPVEKGKHIWAEGIKIDPEMTSHCLRMYKLCHYRN